MAQLSPSDRFRVRDPPESGSWLAPRAATAVVVVVFVTLGHGTWVGQWCGLWNRTGQCLGHLTCLSHNSNSTVLTLSPARELLQNLPKNLSLEPTHTMRVSSLENGGKRRARAEMPTRTEENHSAAQGYWASLVSLSWVAAVALFKSWAPLSGLSFPRFPILSVLIALRDGDSAWTDRHDCTELGR